MAGFDGSPFLRSPWISVNTSYWLTAQQTRGSNPRTSVSVNGVVVARKGEKQAYALLDIAFGELAEGHLANVDLELEQGVLHGLDVEYQRH
jgi:hypothetical protein